MEHQSRLVNGSIFRRLCCLKTLALSARKTRQEKPKPGKWNTLVSNSQSLKIGLMLALVLLLPYNAARSADDHLGINLFQLEANGGLPSPNGRYSRYSQSASQPSTEGRAIQLNVADPKQLSIGARMGVTLPSGQITNGRVEFTMPVEPRSRSQSLAQSLQAATEQVVISLEDGLGSVELHYTGNQISSLLINESATRKIYKAVLDQNQTGQLFEEDANDYYCVDFPARDLPGQSPLSALSEPEIAAATPDIATLQNLQSKPGSSQVLYINYWGGTLSGTAWNVNDNGGNDIIYTPYSSDADTANFSTTDRYRMWLGYEEAAEDYAAFDINVTTSQAVYDATPTANRVQLIATTTNYFRPGSGGVAYVGIFHNTTEYHKTGWVWNSGAGTLGMTISHEAGHQMGLGHDGTFDGTSTVTYYSGHGEWGPIMGGPFFKPYVQWSKGDYTHANNQEDDIGIINTVLGASADEAGNTSNLATPLITPVTDHEGHISPDGLNADEDFYQFYASGATQIEVKTRLGDEGEDRAANLAFSATLEDANNNLIATMTSGDSVPISPLTNTLTYNVGSLAAGLYTLQINADSPDSNWATGFDEYDNGGIYRISVSTDVAGAPSYALNYAAGSNGTLSGVLSQDVVFAHNGTAVTADPDDGYFFIDWSDGSTENPRTDQAVNGAISVTANFSDVGFIVTSSVSGNGTISPLGDQSVDPGATQQFTITPDSGYYLIEVTGTCGGSLNVAGDTYTTNPVTANCTVLAVFNRPAITSPADGSNLSQASETFSWTDNNVGSSSSQFYLDVGTSPGAYDIYSTGGNLLVFDTSAVVSGIPINTSTTVYARLYYWAPNDRVSYVDHSYTTNPPNFTLTYTAGNNGSISGTSPQTVVLGGSGTAITALADEDHHFVDWSDGSTANPRTDSNVSADISVTANFSLNSYTLNYTAGSNGRISGTTPQTVDHGADGSAVTAVPATNYHFVDWSDGSTSNPRTDTNITANISISANFAIDTYSVNYLAGSNGNITGSAAQTVSHGGSSSAVTAVGADGFEFVNWSDGSTSNPRSDLNVTDDISVTANFGIANYSVEYAAGDHGEITGVASQTVAHGSDASTVTATADVNYHFVKWSDESTDNPRLDTNITSDISVTAVFAINRYTLAYTAGSNGSVSGTTPQTVNHGASGSAVTAMPAENHHFVKWSDESTDNPRTDTNVISDVSVEAIFAIDAYTLTYTASSNGSISGTTPQTVDHGVSGSAVTAVGDVGYEFDRWSDGSLVNPRTDTNIGADLSVSASFKLANYIVTPSVSGGNGRINPSTAMTIEYGSSQTFALTPDLGYHLDAVIGSCSGNTGVMEFVTGVISADCDVIATFDNSLPALLLVEPGTDISSPKATFNWTANANPVIDYQLTVGTSIGGTELFDSNPLGVVTSIEVSNLPISDGGEVFVRLRFNIGGIWDFIDYRYTLSEDDFLLQMLPAILSGARARSGS